MNRRGFLGLLSAIPIAAAAPARASAHGRPQVRIQDLDPSTVVHDSICIHCGEDGETATFRVVGPAPTVGQWIRIVFNGEVFFAGQILRVERRLMTWPTPPRNISDVYAESPARVRASKERTANDVAAAFLDAMRRRPYYDRVTG